MKKFCNIINTLPTMDTSSTRVLYTLLLVVTYILVTTDCKDFQCDFEGLRYNFCSFVQSASADFNWTLHQDSHTGALAPPVDHTTGTTSGRYICIERSSSQGEAILQTPVVYPRTETRCVEFYYYMRVTHGSIAVSYRNADNATVNEVLRLTLTQRIKWTRALVEISPQAFNYSIEFSGRRGPNYQGFMAIDDVKVTSGNCPAKKLFCDFENEKLCGYSFDDSVELTLSRRAGETPSYLTGPTFDHTYSNETGYYLHLETSSTDEGEKARLVSPPFIGNQPGGSNCLILWYHMFGDSVGTLTISLRNSTTSEVHYPMWTKMGNHGNVWRAAELVLDSTLDFQLIIEMFSAGSYRGDIAVDDLNVTGEECPGTYTEVLLNGVDCDFEEMQLCGYEQDNTDDLDWKWQNQATTDRFTGPDMDHTKGTELGFYLVAIGHTLATPGSKARIMSPLIEPTQETSCLQFWYYMYGHDVEKLRVYVMEVNTSLPATPLWSERGNMGNTWHRVIVTMETRSAQFRVVFEATSGVKERDDIAIDDVRLFRNENCPAITTDVPQSTPRPDFENDISCDFENSDDPFCGYTQAIDDIFDWTWHNGPTASVGSGPRYDHTLYTVDGHYLLMDCQNTFLRFNDRARLVSPYLARSSSERKLFFWFYKYSTDFLETQDFLNVYYMERGHRLKFDPDFVYFGVTEERDVWYKGCIDIPTDKEGQVIFEGSIPLNEFYCDIAVDDISLEAGSCPPGTETDIATDLLCNFDSILNPLCGWKQDSSLDTLDWTVRHGPTPSEGTGPLNDHTKGNANGKYIYMEASQPSRPTDNAIIWSPVIDGQNDPMCLQLFYHMNGNDIGWLRVLQNMGSELAMKSLGKITGEQRKGWNALLLDIKPYPGKFQILIEGQIGSGYLGDIAIDDIKTVRTPCGGYPTEISCSFEHGFDDCLYDEIMSHGLRRWAWFDYLSDTPLIQAGFGSYMYASALTAGGGDTFYIATNTFSGHGKDHCLMFDIATHIDTSIILDVSLSTPSGKSFLQKLANLHYTFWTTISIDIPAEKLSDTNQISFRAIILSSPGTIGIDNVSVKVGSCPGSKEVEGIAVVSTGKPKLSISKAVVVVLGILFGIVLLLLAIGSILCVQRSREARRPPAAEYVPDGGSDRQSNLSEQPDIANPNYELSKILS